MSNPWFLESLAKDRQREFLGWGGRYVVGSPDRAASPHRGEGAIGNLAHWVRSIRRSNPERTHLRREAFDLAATTQRYSGIVDNPE
jgi:hypothetical protein